MPLAMLVPIAAPLVPNAGIGPSPRMSTTLNAMLSAVSASPSIIGVRASPAERSAPPSMKNTSCPLENTNMMRRNGSASVLTAGAAFTKSSSVGAAKNPMGARTSHARPIAVGHASRHTAGRSGPSMMDRSNLRRSTPPAGVAGIATAGIAGDAAGEAPATSGDGVTDGTDTALVYAIQRLRARTSEQDGEPER